MWRRFSAVTIALAIFAGPAASAQARFSRNGGEQAPRAGAIRQAPPTPSPSTTDRSGTPQAPVDARSTSTMTIVPRIIGLPSFPFVVPIGLGWASFGYVPAWPVAAADLPLQGGGGVIMSPSDEAPTGGLQIDVDPRNAQVYVDGAQAGVVSDFSGYYQHMDLVAGPHLVTIVAPGYDPLIIQVMISPGRTFTYRGTLVRTSGR